MSCIEEITQDIIINCEKPITGGYTGRGVMVQYKDAPTIVTDATNPRKVKSITLGSGKKFVKINNVFTEPFAGSNTQSGADSGRASFAKTISIRIPKRGADVSAGIVEPMVNDAMGFLLVLEKKDKTLDGGFEVVGLQVNAKVDPASITRDESANGGDTTINVVANESYYECTFVGTGNDYETALAEFETMYNNSKNA